jgi:hypothetical protein
VGLASSQNAHTVHFEIESKGKTLQSITCDIINNDFLCFGQFSDGEIKIEDEAKRGFYMVVVDATKFRIKESNFSLHRFIE